MNEDHITEEWLAEVGFKWHQLERQPDKMWLLWLGNALREPDGERRMFSSHSDLGIELTPVRPLKEDGNVWHCWLRADHSGRYNRFLHVRHLQTQNELIRLIEALTGQGWDVANNLHGAMRTPEQAAYLRKEDERLDRVMMRSQGWDEVEKDETIGGALPEHLQAYEKGRRES